jgi:adenylosuccinate synthase
MNNITVVIGANFGDEGKGLMTDYLARTKKAELVVRFNGGAQAGHTVVTPEGKRHVHSHFGAGTLAGIPTHLSRYFIVNPIIFRKEHEALLAKGESPLMSMDPRCLMTTPWDMLWNQYKEEMKGAGRHGSCGMGIDATISRHARHLTDTFFVPHTLIGAWGWYKKIFSQELVVHPSRFDRREQDIYDRYQLLFNNPDIYQRFQEDVDYMYGIMKRQTLPGFSHAIFEGAQGLLLDKHMGKFPWVTNSNTGLRNVLNIRREYNLEVDEIVYVTRSYLTRHGAGPFKEFPEVPAGLTDDTNVPNEWQGTLRYGPLDVPELWRRIQLDLNANGLSFTTSTNSPVALALTHQDQLYNTTCRGLNVPIYSSFGSSSNFVTKGWD